MDKILRHAREKSEGEQRLPEHYEPLAICAEFQSQINLNLFVHIKSVTSRLTCFTIRLGGKQGRLIRGLLKLDSPLRQRKKAKERVRLSVGWRPIKITSASRKRQLKMKHVSQFLVSSQREAVLN